MRDLLKQVVIGVLFVGGVGGAVGFISRPSHGGVD